MRGELYGYGTMTEAPLSKSIANADVPGFCYTDGEVLEISECLFEAMERLDPTVLEKPSWGEMAAGDREFFRYCVNEVLICAASIQARRPAETK